MYASTRRTFKMLCKISCNHRWYTILLYVATAKQLTEFYEISTVCLWFQHLQIFLCFSLSLPLSSYQSVIRPNMCVCVYFWSLVCRTEMKWTNNSSWVIKVKRFIKCDSMVSSTYTCHGHICTALTHTTTQYIYDRRNKWKFKMWPNTRVRTMSTEYKWIFNMNFNVCGPKILWNYISSISTEGIIFHFVYRSQK